MADVQTTLSLTMSDHERDILRPWLTRKQEARDDRKQYEPQWRKNQAFAAGIQWLEWNPTSGEVRELSKDPVTKRLLDTVDVLGQYNKTAVGKLAAGDFRPELLPLYDKDAGAQDYTEQLNDGLAFAWDEEIKADRRLLATLRCLVELGTCGMRCRYDRTKGKLIHPNWPHLNGRPIPGRAEAIQALQDPAMQGQISMRPWREGKIVWEKLSPWNLLPPPGIEDPDDFPWHLIVRPVALTDLIATYGDRARGVKEDKIEDIGLRGAQGIGGSSAPGLNQTSSPSVATKLKGQALTYTGYKTPDADFPEGQTVVFTNDGHLLAADESQPYQLEPWGPRAGLTYFRWDVLEGRFWGRAFMEPGMGPQKIRNKRESQKDQLIDSGLPKIAAEEGSIDLNRFKGDPNSFILVKPGSPLPQLMASGLGAAANLNQDVEAQDMNIERALGLHDSSVGQTPAGVSAYAAMAHLSESDAQKLDPIAQEFRAGIADLVRDTIEAMKAWPSDKQLLIAGEENALRKEAFDAKNTIPPAFLVKPAKGSALPRSQAAEVQKVVDIGNYAALLGLAQREPDKWMSWYQESLDAGKAQPIPESMAVDQAHRAELENTLMSYGAPAPPVAEFDDATIHIEKVRERQMEVQTALGYAVAGGDQQTAQKLGLELQQLQLHAEAHLIQAQQNAAKNAQNQAAQAPGVPPQQVPPPAGPQAQQPQSAPPLGVAA